jgi:hypothetical protein
VGRRARAPFSALTSRSDLGRLRRRVRGAVRRRSAQRDAGHKRHHQGQSP